MSEEAEASPPSADMFDLVLQRDLANIVSKASSGAPLSGRERAMIEAEKQRLASPAAKAVAAPDFKLDSDLPSLVGLKTAELAEKWGHSLRTIKYWIAEGRAKNDPAPLTRPADMPAWFERVHAPRQCPDKLNLAVQRLLAGGESSAKTADANTAANKPVARVEIAEEEKGMLAMLNRHREAEATLHAKYMAAVDAGDESKTGFLLSEWSKMGEKLRALEKAAPKALEELGIYVRRDHIQRELEPLHAAIIKGFRQAFRMSRPRLKAAETSDVWNRIVDQLVDEVCSMLTETEFREPLELEAA